MARVNADAETCVDHDVGVLLFIWRVLNHATGPPQRRVLLGAG
jgi:hypothetical protein